MKIENSNTLLTHLGKNLEFLKIKLIAYAASTLMLVSCLSPPMFTGINVVYLDNGKPTDSAAIIFEDSKGEVMKNVRYESSIENDSTTLYAFLEGEAQYIEDSITATLYIYENGIQAAIRMKPVSLKGYEWCWISIDRIYNDNRGKYWQKEYESIDFPDSIQGDHGFDSLYIKYDFGN